LRPCWYSPSRLRSAPLALLVWLATGTIRAQQSSSKIPPISPEVQAKIDSAVPAILAEFKVATAGIGVIRGGRLTWAGYYGEQAPGVPASRATMFNVASITKTVAAETILRLATAGKLSLDEPMSVHWIDPDLVRDSRHSRLTPRMVLNHTTGFPNWRSGGSPLAFVAAPGTRFTYSGEGFNYVARFVEEKLGTRFDQLVDEYVIDPVGLTHISLSTPNAWVSPHVALPTHEAGDGRRLFPSCNTTGQFCLCRGDPRPLCRRWTVADDMLVSVEDYAAFLIDVMEGKTLDSTIRATRFRPHALPRDDWQIVDCTSTPPVRCPVGEGWALGWEVVDYGDDKIVSHGGADWGEVAVAYFYSSSRDGLIVFLNGRRPAANGAMESIIRLLDATSPLAGRYARWHSQ
jgi:CubicO group peptidase (beta-lactamase class C family)